MQDSEDRYHVRIGDKVDGPLTRERIERGLATGEMPADAPARLDWSDEWPPSREVLSETKPHCDPAPSAGSAEFSAATHVQLAATASQTQPAPASFPAQAEGGDLFAASTARQVPAQPARWRWGQIAGIAAGVLVVVAVLVPRSRP